MANTTADKTPISLDNLARNNERMKEYIQGEIDKIPTGGSITIDDALSDTSENPVQNKVINSALTSKADSLHTHTKAEITDFPTSLPASDVKAWAKADTKPTYTASEVGADASGSANTALTNAKSYTDTKIADLINGAPTTLDTLGEIATAMEENQSVVEALNTAIGTKANASDLTAHTGNKSNPHGVTKSQVGLGNVPNVATNDQTPSYTEATSLAKLSSGEKLSIAFGKISKAITDLISHISDSVKHITSTERTNWNSAKTHADSAHAPSNAQANQNAFSNIVVGSTTVAADTATDTLTLVGSNVTLTPDATNDKVTIGITKANVTSALGYTPPTTNTTYTSKNAVSGGTDVSLVTTGEKYNWNTAKNHADSAHAPSNAQANVIETIKVNGTALTPSSKAVDITVPSYSAMTGATSSAAGTSGLVPAPASGKQASYLRGDGTWAVPTNTDTKVTNTLNTTTKAYITGTTSSSTNTGTQIFDTGVYLDTTAGMLTATTFKGALSGNATTSTTSDKLASTSYTTITINPSDWTTNSDGGFSYIADIGDLSNYTNFNIDILLSSDQDAAKLQLESWGYIISDGNIIRQTSPGGAITMNFIFEAFTTQPSVALTIGVQGVS